MYFRSSIQAALLLCAAGSTYGQLYVPQEVLSYASSALSEFSAYSEYRGPSTAEAAKATQSASAAHVQVAVAAAAAAPSCSFWMENITHQGLAAFNANPTTYQVFRNVKDFGAKGDGVTDDTAAIQSAISSGGRCKPGSCASTTTTPAVVYFPAGTYMVSSSITDYYYTQLIGNPNCMPTIRATAGFTQPSGNIGIIDGDPYVGSTLGFGATNVFWRQVRNFVIDLTLLPATANIAGVHWPTGQATSLQNIVFKMSTAANTQQLGVFIESGSGGFMNDLVFQGGMIGLNVGNQQFTMRNLTFNSVQTGINQIWDWGWTYQSLSFNNCTTGISLNGGAPSDLSVGSVTLLDSSFVNTKVGLVTGKSGSSAPATANSLVLENIQLSNVPTAVQGPSGVLIGNVASIAGYANGNSYTPTGPNVLSGNIAGNTRPASLVTSTGKYYQRSKPQYGAYPVSSFISARSSGAKGDGKTDDTAALQAAITNAKNQGKILYVDHGDYLVTSTLYIPSGSKIVGETYSVILSSGSFFNNIANPQPVVQIGKPGEAGSIEWSDMIVSTKGQQQGAILFQYNLVAPAGTPSGLWDVHARIGGFAGSNLQVANCPTTPGTTITSTNLNQNCISVFLTMHITPGSTGLYLENNWLWVADHDVDNASLTQITVYAGRGLLDESAGPVWFVGTAVEHHSRYQYQFANAKNVFQGQIQTETAYYEPNPIPRIPFPFNATYFDPSWPGANTVTDAGYTIPAANGWGLRIYNSQNILTYGAGLYSFFNNYNTSCSNQGNGVQCQSRIVSIEGTSSGISIYNLNTVGAHWPITVNGTDEAIWSSDQDGFVQTIAMYRK